MSSSAQNSISGFFEIGQKIANRLYFEKLGDTPTGYLGHSGDYLVVSNDETSIHFTGIEKIVQDLTDYGFSAGETTFTGLSDTPSDFTAGKYLRVNDAGDALEYVDITGVSSGGGGGQIHARFSGSTGAILTKSSNWDTYVDSITFPQGSWNGYLRINYKNDFTTVPTTLATADHRENVTNLHVFAQVQSQSVSNCDIVIGDTEKAQVQAAFNVVIFSDEIAGGSGGAGQCGINSLELTNDHPSADSINIAIPDAIIAETSFGNDHIFSLSVLNKNSTDLANNRNLIYTSYGTQYSIDFTNDTNGSYNQSQGVIAAHQQNLKWFIDNGRALYYGSCGSSGGSSSAIVFDSTIDSMTVPSIDTNTKVPYSPDVDTYSAWDSTNNYWVAPKDMTVLVTSYHLMHNNHLHFTAYIRVDGVIKSVSNATKDSTNTNDTALNCSAVVELTAGAKLYTDIQINGVTASRTASKQSMTITELSGGGGGGSAGSDLTDFVSLTDTPVDYIGHSGDYMIVNDGESGIHFTGIEKIAQDLDSIKYNEIPQYTTSDMPQADTQGGKIVASGCDLYYSCNGEWSPVNSPLSAPKNAPSCISNIEEYVEYNEYRDQFLSDNMLDSLKNALEYDIDPLILDVCVSPESNLAIENNVVKIEETTYKWGLFNSAQTINISATPYSDAFGNDCVFENWDSSQASFANEFSPNTSVLVDQDMSITGYFRCNLAPSPISEEQVFLNLQSSNTEILEKSIYNHNLNNINEVIVDNQNKLLNTNTLNFTGVSYIEVGESNDFQFLHDGSSDYTVEFWTKVKETPVTIDFDNPEGGSVGTQMGYVAGSPANMFDGDNSTYYGINNFARLAAFSMQLATWFTKPITNIDRIDWRFLVDECCGGRSIYIHDAEQDRWVGVGSGPGGSYTREVSFTNGGNVYPPFDAIKSIYGGSSSGRRNFRTYELRFYQNHSNPDVATTTVNPVSASEPILSTANASNMHGINIAIQGSSLQSTIYNGTNSPYLARLSSSTEIQANEWQHVALTFDRNLNKIYMHLNGVYQGEYAAINNLSQNPQSQILKIGSSNNGTAFQFLNGNIQDLRISKGIIYSDRGPFFTPNQLF